MVNNTGGPAFPTDNYAAMVPLSTGYSEGMTLRDYFAAKAMQGMLANGESGLQTLSQAAYILADAMLAARNQK